MFPQFVQMIVRTVSGVFDKIGELSNKAQEVLPRLPGKKDNSISLDEERPNEDVHQMKVEYCIVMDHVSVNRD